MNHLKNQLYIVRNQTVTFKICKDIFIIINYDKKKLKITIDFYERESNTCYDK